MDITLLETSSWRGKKQPVGIKPADERQHIHVIGTTGMGRGCTFANDRENAASLWNEGFGSSTAVSRGNPQL